MPQRVALAVMGSSASYMQVQLKLDESRESGIDACVSNVSYTVLTPLRLCPYFCGPWGGGGPKLATQTEAVSGPATRS